MSCRVSKGRRTTNGRRSLKLRLFGFKQSCFPQAVKKEIELGYNVFCAGGIVNSCCRCDGSRRTSRALRTGLAPWTFWALGALWAGCSLWTCCSHLTLWSLRPSCSRFTYRTLWPLRSCSSCLSCWPLGTGRGDVKRKVAITLKNQGEIKNKRLSHYAESRPGKTGRLFCVVGLERRKIFLVEN